MKNTGSPLFPMQEYRPPSETRITLPFLLGCVPSYQSYSQPAEPFTEQVSLTVPPTGMMVVSALSVAFGLFAVQFRQKTKQVNSLKDIDCNKVLNKNRELSFWCRIIIFTGHFEF